MSAGIDFGSRACGIVKEVRCIGEGVTEGDVAKSASIGGLLALSLVPDGFIRNFKIKALSKRGMLT